MRKKFLIFSICILVLFIFFISRKNILLPYNNKVSIKDRDTIDVDTLKYSNTQKEIVDYLKEALQFELNYLPANWKDIVKLQAPPKNSSTTTKNELLDLHKLILSRDEKELKKIKQEQYKEGMYICDVDLNIFIEHKDENIKTLFSRFSKDILHVVTVEKLLFDRVRPSILDNTLTTVIDVPMHPSYPSGHSTQFYAYALLLSEFFPERREEFIDCARQVAKRREIAGLHYESDSKAGEVLAEQIYLLMKPKMLNEIEKASPLIKNNLLNLSA